MDYLLNISSSSSSSSDYFKLLELNNDCILLIAEQLNNDDRRKLAKTCQRLRNLLHSKKAIPSLDLRKNMDWCVVGLYEEHSVIFSSGPVQRVEGGKFELRETSQLQGATLEYTIAQYHQARREKDDYRYILYNLLKEIAEYCSLKLFVVHFELGEVQYLDLTASHIFRIFPEITVQFGNGIFVHRMGDFIGLLIQELIDSASDKAQIMMCINYCWTCIYDRRAFVVNLEWLQSIVVHVVPKPGMKIVYGNFENEDRLKAIQTRLERDKVDIPRAIEDWICIRKNEKENTVTIQLDPGPTDN